MIIFPTFGGAFLSLSVSPDPTLKSYEGRRGDQQTEIITGEKRRRADFSRLHLAFERSSGTLIPPFTRCVADDDGFGVIKCFDLEESSRTVALVNTNEIGQQNLKGG